MENCWGTLNQSGVNNYYYYHYDAQGNVVAVTDSNGVVYRQYVYDPYGNIISVKDGSGNAINIGNDPGFNNAYTYRGYRFDSETGLYFLQSRYYAAGIGRFLTKDISSGVSKNSSRLNLYTYCGGNPVNFSDPSGHVFIVDDAIELGAVAAVAFLESPEGQELIQEGEAIAEDASNELVNLASQQRTTHILYGDETGGGHLWPGVEGKSIFPESWGAEQTMNNISDIVTDPNSTWQLGRIVKGVQRYEVIGVRDGLTIKVITDGSDIITAFPIN